MSAYPNAIFLQKLIERTHQLLRLYYNKNQWHHITPLLAQLSDAYIQLYSQNPVALQAQLQIYIKSQGYTTNMVVNEVVLVLAVCKHFGYSEKVTAELVSACLANYLCVTNENNAMARSEPVSTQTKKQWQFRHHLAVKLFERSGTTTNEITHILMRLTKYQKALNYPDLINLYDFKTLIVAVADLIARRITPKSSNEKTNPLKDTVKELYLSAASEKVRTVLKALVAELEYPFPGQLTRYKGYNAFCLKHAKTHTELCVVNDKKQLQTITTEQHLHFRQSSIPLVDPTLIFGIWFARKQVDDIRSEEAEQPSVIETAVELGHHDFVSYQQIEKALSCHPNLVERLLTAARQYNKQQQKAGGLRHSLTMVGLDNAALMCQRVLLEQSLEDYAHPLMAEVLSRYAITLKAVQAYTALQTTYHFEAIAGPFTAYVYYLLCTYQDIKWQIPDVEFEQEATPLSYAYIFGISSVDNKTVCESIQAHFSFSGAHKAFISSELSSKDQLIGLSKAMVFIKLAVYRLLKPEVPFSAWQKALIQEQLNSLSVTDFEHFVGKIIEQAPYNPI
ncbi:hypothetical protein [Pseudoalteromonas xiamenensis]